MKARFKSSKLVSALLLGLWVCLALLGAAWRPQQRATAADAAQVPIYTPTPGPDGRIIYIVKANDTLLSISLITGVPVETLKSLNKLTSDTIYEGQQLLLGFAGPAEVTFTPGPSPTPTALLPTPTPKPGQGTLCILLFNDINGDSIRQDSEASLPGGQISFSNRSGSVSQTEFTAAGTEARCFENLPEGEYIISVAIPEGYNPTTSSSYTLLLKSGDQSYLNFGAQPNSQTLAQQPAIPAAEGQRSPILGIIGGVLLLAGVGVAIFAGRMARGR